LQTENNDRKRRSRRAKADWYDDEGGLFVCSWSRYA